METSSTNDPRIHFVSPTVFEERGFALNDFVIKDKLFVKGVTVGNKLIIKEKLFVKGITVTDELYVNKHIICNGFISGPTPSIGDRTTRMATTEYVQNELTYLINVAPNSLNTLNELSFNLNDDVNACQYIDEIKDDPVLESIELERFCN